MKNIKTFQLVMLPTKKAPLAILANYLHHSKYSDFEKDDKFIPQHLYIISDEECKEDEYCTNFEEVAKVNCLTVNDPKKHLYKKIIATTDKSLDIPLIPYSFLPPFIKAWNENNKITEVNLEMCGGANDPFIQIEYKKIKLREDGTVIILENKKYTKEDMKIAFECGRQYQLTGENNLNEIL